VVFIRLVFIVIVLEECGGERLGSGNVPFLRRLVAASEQKNDLGSDPDEIDAIAGPIVNSQLANSVTHGTPVAHMSRRQPSKPREDLDASGRVC
jgi:hypothetical protein